MESKPQTFSLIRNQEQAQGVSLLRQQEQSKQPDRRTAKSCPNHKGD